jgi:transposase-like protein
VIVVICPQRAEASLLAAQMRCPGCAGVLRPHGHARDRTVRGLGDVTLRIRPRRTRCADCQATHVLLPGALIRRRADSTEVIGHALAAKSSGAGFRSIAAQLGRPKSTVRSWLRRASEPHAQWLYQQAVQRCAKIDRELLVHPAAHSSVLGHALNLLAGAAVRYRERFGEDDPLWALIGAFSYGYLLAPPSII